MENLVQQTIFATSSSRVRTTGHAYPQQVAMNVNVHLVGKERTVLIMSILAMVRYSFILHVVNFILDGPTPCQNGGECQLANGGMDFTCHCKNNYSGKYCELFHERAFDVFINQQPYRNWFKINFSSKLLLQCELQASCNAFSCKPVAWWLKIIKKFTIRSTQWQSVCEWRVLQHNKSKVQLYWWFHWQQLWKGKTSFLVSYLAHFFIAKGWKYF